MSRLPSTAPVVEAKPQANVYTVLLIVAVLALVLSTGIVGYRLMAPLSQGTAEAQVEGPGYGLEFGQLFEPAEKLAEGEPAGPARGR